MKAIVYQNAHPVEHFSMELLDVPDPQMSNTDILIEVRAVGINPGEAFFRRSRNAEPGGHVLLGWEFSGVVTKHGPATRGFHVGDRVFGTGDLRRNGCWAEKLAIDFRTITHIPESLSFADAASLPIGGLTAWESLFREGDQLPQGTKRVLIVGGAGAVGSMAIQLLNARSDVFVIATASREESRQWCKTMGADLVVDHTSDIRAQLANAAIDSIDLIVATRGIDKHISWIPSVLRPYGHLSACDLTGPIDMSGLFMKSISLHLEMVFSKGMNNYQLESQSKILDTISSLVREGRVRSIRNTLLKGLNAQTMKNAHQQIESGKTIGKIVIEF